jgi:hypothetical protein
MTSTASEPEPDDRAPYSDATLARLVVSVIAQELSDTLAGWVPIGPNDLPTDDPRRRPPLDHTSVEEANRLPSQIHAFRRAVVIYKKVTGATWQTIGRGLGVSRQSAQARYADAVADFQAEAQRADASGARSSRLPAGADDPDAWGPRLDAWCQQHPRATDPERNAAPVTGGMVRMHPIRELLRTEKRRHALLNEHIRPPAEPLLALLERELELWQQLGSPNRDTAERVKRTTQHIAELRASLEDARGDS